MKKSLKQAIAAALFAVTVAVPTAAPATAEASVLEDVLGTVLVGGVASLQLDETISKYNNSEEGRQEFNQQIREQLGVDNDPVLNALLDNIMGNLTVAIAQVDPSINDEPYNYFINPQDSFNAFCTLGHNMSVNRGLFSLVDNDDEIAVVLGHEMGHGQKDHPAKGARNVLNAQILGAVLGSAVGSDVVGAVAGNLIANQGITKPQEWEADNLAFDYLCASNYNIGACAAIWQRVLDKNGDSNESFASLMVGGSDHPSNKERRDNYYNKIKEYSNGRVDISENLVRVNGNDFVTLVDAEGMSGAERACFTAGALARAFHNQQHIYGAKADDGRLTLGDVVILTPAEGDEDIAVLAQRLNDLLK